VVAGTIANAVLVPAPLLACVQGSRDGVAGRVEENDYIPDLGLDDNYPEPVLETANPWLQGRRRRAIAEPVSKLPAHMKVIRK
jgi:hypothetical protein